MTDNLDHVLLGLISAITWALILVNMRFLTNEIRKLKFDAQQIKTSQRASQKRELKTTRVLTKLVNKDKKETAREALRFLGKNKTSR